MAKRRTKEQKMRAQEERAVVVQTGAATVNNTAVQRSYTFVSPTKPNTADSVLPQKTMSYITQDLLKTAVTASVLFAVLVGIYLYLSYN